MVCIFLIGGNDHANTLVPYDVANYGRYLNHRGAISYRHEDLAPTLLAPRGGQELTDHLQYAFAPQLPRFKILFDSGKMAGLLNVGPLVVPLTRAQYDGNNRALYPLPPKLFSHNDQQSIWQADGSEGATVGWGGRFGDLALSGNGHALLTCISAAGNAVFVSGENALQYQISPHGRDSGADRSASHLYANRARSARRCTSSSPRRGRSTISRMSLRSSRAARSRWKAWSTARSAG